MAHHITTAQRDFFSTWQHNPALSSKAMTHISLSVSRRGGVQNDALAWKILFEGTCWGLTEQPDWGGGEMSWYCHSAKSFFVSTVGCEPLRLYSHSLSIQEHLSIGQLICSSLWTWANQYWNLSWPVLISRVTATHQGAVVQQGSGEVAVEAERQDMSLSGAESHFVFWQD